VSSGDRETQLSRFNEAIDQAVHESVVRYAGEVNRARDMFLGILGHDLRAPLGATVLSAHYLLRSEGLSGEQLKAAAAILRGGTQIQKITSDLLDVTRTRFGGALPIEPKPMNLFHSCQQVVEEAQAFHPDRTITLTSMDDLRGTWDETRLYQLLSNLVGNAIRHGANAKPVKVATAAEAEQVQITVHNDGPPIPKSEIHHIFDPMRQTVDGAKHTEGLGLGLYIARAITKAHHGAINVESNEETGTTFTVRLPRHYLPNRRATDRAGGQPS
jgi:signal transduction histidine kinase